MNWVHAMVYQKLLNESHELACYVSCRSSKLCSSFSFMLFWQNLILIKAWPIQLYQHFLAKPSKLPLTAHLWILAVRKSGQAPADGRPSRSSSRCQCQLCIVNAFEQVLEEKTPRFHASCVVPWPLWLSLCQISRRNGHADLIYYLMKPLEWLFTYPHPA